MSQERIAPASEGAESSHRWAAVQLEHALRNLRFGQVILTVQDGVVVQVERTERRRFRNEADASAKRR